MNYKRSIGASPYQVVYGYSHFDPEIKISEVQPRRKAKRATNYPHKKIRVDQTVYIKVFNAGKLDKQYEGPYVVAEVGPKGNWIK